MFLRLQGLIDREETGNDGSGEKAVIIPGAGAKREALIEKKRRPGSVDYS